ncbi:MULTISPECIES: hypothetical protein [Atlantibacter]|uniref:Uncharacterized protein n=1 Tax=Atlantibacter subterraneus TaxID=255519 RepID=A0ABU4E5S5_9ENTR|nr:MULTISPECIES: hypothetical protein [Atlantibacter]MDV7024465.1 hypothetical protein [Atlantibacter subterranea]MDW2745029.1 hypothetical protein [Atlantibacter subterranea]MDZ5667561.1 hypothetical protein [Atlantibacter hermannii]QFH72916.1 hypothetical protein FR762_24470 [Enterobacter sp. E76]
MHTQNVNVRTATRKSNERWVKNIARIIDRAHYNVACAEEAHAHYGEKLTLTDTCVYFIRGALSAVFNKS